MSEPNLHVSHTGGVQRRLTALPEELTEALTK